MHVSDYNNTQSIGLEGFPTCYTFKYLHLFYMACPTINQSEQPGLCFNKTQAHIAVIVHRFSGMHF